MVLHYRHNRRIQRSIEKILEIVLEKNGHINRIAILDHVFILVKEFRSLFLLYLYVNMVRIY